jgi:hypothetical protein
MGINDSLLCTHPDTPTLHSVHTLKHFSFTIYLKLSSKLRLRVPSGLIFQVPLYLLRNSSSSEVRIYVRGHL